MSSGEAGAGTVARERLNALPVRTYLDETCVPLLMQAMSAVSRERPEDPIEYIAHYLLAHNPRRLADGGALSSPLKR